MITLTKDQAEMTARAGMQSGIIMGTKKPAVLDKVFAACNWWSDWTGQEVDFAEVSEALGAALE